LEIEVTEIREIPVVRIIGEVDLHTCTDLRTTLKRLMSQGKNRIVLDMQQVPYVDSAALGVLVDAQRRVREMEGEIHLMQVTPFVLRAFEITRLVRLFRFADTLDAAVHSAEGDLGEAA